MPNASREARHQAAAPKLRRALRLVGWNGVLLVAGLGLVVLTGEVWLRSTVPFVSPYLAKVFVPDVGVLLRPDTEIRSTNRLDFWTVSRTNSLGFLDREPIRSERAAESCHITMIGASFVAAREVLISEKFHVSLEEMAARELPHLDVTTSAFGMNGTGQISQLAFYDEYARHLYPEMVVLVFTPHDYIANFPLWQAIRTGLNPEHLPYISAARAEDGSFRLRPPDPDYRCFRLPRLSGPPSTPEGRALIRGKRGFRTSRFVDWLCTKFSDGTLTSQQVGWAKLLSRRSAYGALLDGWRPVSRGNTQMRFANEAPRASLRCSRRGNGHPFYEEALAFTAFGLDEFKARTERDGAALVILASHRMHRFGGGTFARLNEMAAERRIPVIDQAEVIYRQGAELRDAGWAHNDHWNPTGHQWAAEALLEYLKRNPGVCE